MQPVDEAEAATNPSADVLKADLWSAEGAAMIPFDWVYSYNRGMNYPDDIEIHKYRPDAKICVFNTDLTPDPKAKSQIKLEELEDPIMLTLWEGQ